MKFTPIFKNFTQHRDYKPIDLSKSHLNSQAVNILNNTSLSDYIKDIQHNEQAKVLYGGYLEQRGLYDDKEQFKSNTKQRNIHLGVDFWAKEGTEVVAPIDAVVHSYANNSNYGNYGPTIILQHEKGSSKFYSLYGHLSLESIEYLEVGQRITQGSVFASLGDESINIGYVPHLHFQLIKNMQGYIGDYPGVCHIEDLEYYTRNTINPIPFFNF